MRINYFIVALLSIVLLLAGGCASKRLTKKAKLLDEAGLFSDASTLYLNALQRNRNNVDAKLGLSRSGQLVLNQKLEAFKRQYDSNNTREAVYAYKECVNYHQSVKNVGVELYMPAEYNQYYVEVEDRFLNEKYKEGMSFLDVDDFTNATLVFSELVSINGNYKDAKTQLKIAVNEPKYRSAVEQLKNRLPRTAYYGFDAIDKATGGYKDCKDLRAQALEQATITIYVAPFATNWTNSLFQNNLKVETEGAISEIPLPFYRVISTTAPKVGSSRVFTTRDENDVKDLSIKATAQLSGSIISYEAKRLNNQNSTKRCYLEQKIEVYDSVARAKVTKSIYKKVEYSQVVKKNIAKGSVKFVLTESETGRIMVSDLIQDESISEVTLNYFKGDAAVLIPGYWEKRESDSNNDYRTTNVNEIKAFRESFGRSDEPKSPEVLSLDLAAKLSSQIATKIKNYNPEP